MGFEVSRLTRRILMLSTLPGVGRAKLWGISSSPEFVRAEEADLPALFPELGDFRPGSPSFLKAVSAMERQLELAASSAVEIVGFWDNSFPRALRKAPGAPAVIWCRGNSGVLNVASVAVIGTRYPTRAGEVAAYRIGAAFASKGVCVVSGLALGLDTLAHRGALSVGGPTVAVMPCGLHAVAPASNRDLAHEIVDTGGCLVSEFPIGIRAFASNFVARDFTQAALSAATVLVQSGENGGSMHATRATVRLGRPLVVAQPNIDDDARSDRAVAANRVLIRGELAEKRRLLQYSSGPLQIVPLSSRREYDDVIEMVQLQWGSFQPKPPPQE